MSSIRKEEKQQQAEHSATYPELWGGIECTVNRIEDKYLDQVRLSGHSQRVKDLEMFARLGIKTLRYPVLWERTCKSGKPDWRWPDARLERLKELGIKPIAGLVHHGSGLPETNLIDKYFPEKLASYAASVAARYPWIEYYTPVNEPLTTGRFSCLYGHWYPHYKDSYAFARALLVQCRAVVQSMKAIKLINPEAKLVQTEDLGKTYSTPELKYQADFENSRRWLTYDLLCGYVNKYHPMWDYFLYLGISGDEMEFFLDNPYPPDILGINYYITSQRYLDKNLALYPPCTHGGNGRDAYADVEAVRAAGSGFEELPALLKETWSRYKLPIAVTEVHLHCTREEQLRWFKEKWDFAAGLNKEGVPVVAVTAWAMLGSYDWCSLLTKPEGIYEPGVFDVRSYPPRPTILASCIKAVSENKTFTHPVLDVKGWWKRKERIIYGVSSEEETSGIENARTILITGKTGTLGKAFERICRSRGLNARVTCRQDMNICSKEDVRRVISEVKPWAVINTAGYVNVDMAEHEPHICYSGNTNGAVNLSDVCAEEGIKFLTFSSDLVFDGRLNDLYKEKDRVNPLNVYGRSKARAEEQIIKNNPSALIIRTSAFFGPWDEYNFITVSMNRIANGIKVLAAKDLVISPTYVPDLVNAALDLMIDDEKGIWHLANNGSVSWSDFLHIALDISGLSTHLVEPVHSNELHFTAPRPRFSALGSSRGTIMPDLLNAVERYCKEVELVNAG
jgi:dTDP-4-dehydrorhamnose reductase